MSTSAVLLAGGLLRSVSHTLFAMRLYRIVCSEYSICAFVIVGSSSTFSFRRRFNDSCDFSSRPGRILHLIVLHCSVEPIEKSSSDDKKAKKKSSSGSRQKRHSDSEKDESESSSESSSNEKSNDRSESSSSEHERTKTRPSRSHTVDSDSSSSIESQIAVVKEQLVQVG